MLCLTSIKVLIIISSAWPQHLLSVMILEQASNSWSMLQSQYQRYMQLCRYYVLVLAFITPFFAVANAYGTGLTDFDMSSVYGTVRPLQSPSAYHPVLTLCEDLSHVGCAYPATVRLLFGQAFLLLRFPASDSNKSAWYSAYGGSA